MLTNINELKKEKQYFLKLLNDLSTDIHSTEIEDNKNLRLMIMQKVELYKLLCIIDTRIDNYEEQLKGE